jgi:hypothetical protein
MQHDMDMQQGHGHVACTGTRRMDIHMQNGHGDAAWTHGYAAWTHGYAAWTRTCSVDMNLDISMDKWISTFCTYMSMLHVPEHSERVARDVLLFRDSTIKQVFMRHVHVRATCPSTC